MTIKITLDSSHYGDHILVDLTNQKLPSASYVACLNYEGGKKLWEELGRVYGEEFIPKAAPKTVPHLLRSAAGTFEERNSGYKDNKNNVGHVMKAMFPEGVTLKTVEDFTKWHLFELAIVKMTRFANSGLKHEDSIHDGGIYCIMVQKEVIDNG